MQLWIKRAAFAWLLAASTLLALAGDARSQTAPLLSEVRSVLDRGQKLEGERRWGEALSFYEQALREHPGTADLEQRFAAAKLHYDLGRRYGDASYNKSLVSLSERDALGLYAEITLKIQSHYVDEPDWKRLVDRGTAAFSAALSDEVFLNRHLPNTSPARIHQVRREIEDKVGAFAIRSRHEARDAVAYASRYAGEQLGIPSAAAIYEYLCGAANLLDDYSSYLTGDQLSEVYSQIEGNFVGLGIELKNNEGTLEILRVITGSPADKGGLRPGDRIVAVDGQSTLKLNTDQAANMLQGKEGSAVDVSIATPNREPRTLQLRREHVEVPSVDEVKILDTALGIGYLRLTCFQKTTSRDLDAALWKLHRAGMKSLIMDLRGNPGGLLSSSVEVVDKFVDAGNIVSTKGRSSQEDYTYTAHASGTWRVPLVVLIDGDSASASEIFAGAIRDHNRGKIVGTKSYGKGSVQGIFPLNVAGAGIRLTTAKFYSPQGKPFSKIGVIPDVRVQVAAKPIDGSVEASSPSPTSDESDPFVAAGLRVARGETARR